MSYQHRIECEQLRHKLNAALKRAEAAEAKLAELVPDEITYEIAQTHCHRNDRPDITHGFQYGANWMRTTILRNIEDAK